MSTLQEPRLLFKSEIDLTEFRELVYANAPALGRLLDSLDAGKSPGPIAVMDAISQSVAYFTNGESVLARPKGIVDPQGARFCPSC